MSLTKSLLGPAGKFLFGSDDEEEEKKSKDKHMPKSALTGTEKKAKKAELKFTKEVQRQYLKDLQRGKPLKKEARAELQDILAGKHLPTTTYKEYLQKFEKGLGKTEKLLRPMREFETQQAQKEFERFTRPGLVGAAGAGTAGSSALNQALAASAQDLASQISGRFTGLQFDLANQLLGQSEQGKLSALQARLQAAGGGLGQQVHPFTSGIGMAPSYLPKERSGGALGAAFPIGGAILGGALGSIVPGLGTALGAQIGTGVGTAAGTLFR